MFVLLKKEISSFLNSLIGYVVMVVFLMAIGLFMWIIPGQDFNLVENGIAGLDTLFILAPWMFLFLIPAVSMKMFAEEKRSGTMEVLLTQPLSDLEIVLAKYGATLALALFSILPTLIYLGMVAYMAAPAGNVDVAGITGSYIGLIFLCSGFASIGVFASALSNSQVISFILALLLCAAFYSGFDMLLSMPVPPGLSDIISRLGIASHYSSLSRGVIDSRDVIYFLSLSVLFIQLTKFVIAKRKW
ncbi:MAG: gliding motility-associated ABC transporter permease subunit GldF [Bacteroidia bacterium]|nr:gliding motility-associated ABC transporter permease subunit GldF [Bacteroidia bacterium]